jgi:hypothetical protein
MQEAGLLECQGRAARFGENCRAVRTSLAVVGCSIGYGWIVPLVWCDHGSLDFSLTPSPVACDAHLLAHVEV